MKLPKLDLPRDLIAIQGDYESSLDELCKYLKEQMDYIDDTDVSDEDPNLRKCLLFKITKQIIELDSSFIKYKLSKKNGLLAKLLDEITAAGEISCKDGVIFQARVASKEQIIERSNHEGELIRQSSINRLRRESMSADEELKAKKDSDDKNKKDSDDGKQKKDSIGNKQKKDSFSGLRRNSFKAKKSSTDVITRPRRASFFGTDFADKDIVLRVEKLKTWTDLDFLFKLNGYHLPFCGSSTGRSMYEHFSGLFIKKITANESRENFNFDTDEGKKFYRFHILESIIFTIHTTTEQCMSIIECIIDVIMLINMRIKTLKLNNGSLPISEVKHDMLDHLITCFNEKSKIYGDFKTNRIIKTQSDRTDLSNSVSWESRLLSFSSALDDAIELYEPTYTGSKFVMESNRHDEDPKAKAFINDCLIYISSFSDFMAFIKSNNSVYRRMLDYGFELLRALEHAEQSNPTIYGITPRTGRKSNGGTPGRSSKNSSPREEKSSGIGKVFSLVFGRKKSFDGSSSGNEN